MADKTYGTDINEVEINDVYHKVDAASVEGHRVESTGVASNTTTLPTTAQVKSYVDSQSGGSGITEISTRYIRITDLETGVYKLTYNGNKYIYYSGTTSNNITQVRGGSGAVILTVNKGSDTNWHWYYINGITGYDYITYGYTTASSGSTSFKDLNNLLTTKANYLHTIRVTLDSSWAFDFDLLLPKPLNEVLDKNADEYGSTGTGWSLLGNQIGFCSYGCLIFAILADMFDETDTIIPVRNVCPETSTYNYGIRLTGGGTTVYSATDYSGVETSNYSTIQIIRWLKRTPQSFNDYSVVSAYDMQTLSEDDAIQFYFTMCECLYPDEYAYN